MEIVYLLFNLDKLTNILIKTKNNTYHLIEKNDICLWDVNISDRKLISLNGQNEESASFRFKKDESSFYKLYFKYDKWNLDII